MFGALKGALKGMSGAGASAGVKTGPSSFMKGKLAQSLLAGGNAWAQQNAGPGANAMGQGAGLALANRMHRPPNAIPQQPPMAPPPMAPPPMGPSPMIDTGPSYGAAVGSPAMPGNPNPGISGGLFNRPTGYERPPMAAGSNDIGGMFGRYNQMGQFPNRRY